MLRYILIPLAVLFGGIIFSVMSYFIYRKIKRGVQYTFDKSSEISSQYIDKWRSQEQRKKLPKIVQTGFDDFQIIEENIDKLPEEWQLKLLPLKHKSNNLLLEISHHLSNDENFERSKLNSLRSFFNHSVDALKQFSQTLLSEHKSLSTAQQKRAKENIMIIYNDLIRHEKILHKKRKFDFDVMMDVIKERLK